MIAHSYYLSRARKLSSIRKSKKKEIRELEGQYIKAYNSSVNEKGDTDEVQRFFEHANETSVNIDEGNSVNEKGDTDEVQRFFEHANDTSDNIDEEGCSVNEKGDEDWFPEEIVGDSESDVSESESDVSDSESDVYSSEIDVIPDLHKFLSPRLITQRGSNVSDVSVSFDENDVLISPSQPTVSLASDCYSSSYQNAMSDVKVLVSTCKAKGRRQWDKKHYCLFCEKPQSKITRHLQRQHKEESDVTTLLSLQKNTKARKMLLYQLTNKGDYNHNYDVIKKNKGIIIPLKRPTRDVSYREFIPCQHCYGFLKKKDLWKHVKNCPLTNTDSGNTGKNVVKMGQMLLPTCDGATEEIKDVLATMRYCDVGVIAKTDPLICKLGAMVLKRTTSTKSTPYVTQRMREMARLLQKARELTHDPTADLTSFITPLKFKTVLQAVQQLAGYDASTRKYKIPTISLRCGYSLKKCAAILESEGLRNGDPDMVRSSKDFLILYHNDWCTEISKQALDTLEQSRWNKTKTLPVARDIKKLNDHMDDVATKANMSLRNEVGDAATNSVVDDYSRLAKATLAKIILFNRRRSGEAAKMTLEDYAKVTSDPNEDIISSLSPWERDLCQRMKRVEIRGKRGRKVPVLLSVNMMSNLDCLIKNRSRAGVNLNNKFLFALPCRPSLNAYRGHDCLREMACQSDLAEPELMTSTRLRKHVATLSQLVNLKDNEMDIVANFLGHDIRVHREYYRLPESTVQIAKVSKLLLAAEKGGYEKFSGKNLDEVEVSSEVDSSIGEESCESDSDDETGEGESSATIPQNRDGADDSGGVTKRKSQHVHSTPEAKRQRSGEESSGEESRGVTKRKSPDAKSSGGTKRQSTDLGSKDTCVAKKTQTATATFCGQQRDRVREHVLAEFASSIREMKVPGKEQIDASLLKLGMTLPWNIVKNIINAAVQKRKRFARQ